MARAVEIARTTAIALETMTQFKKIAGREKLNATEVFQVIEQVTIGILMECLSGDGLVLGATLMAKHIIELAKEMEIGKAEMDRIRAGRRGN